MDFNHSEDRQMLADTLGRYLQQRYPIDVRNTISGSDEGWSREHWAALAELGVVGALFGEDTGGFGGTGFDVAAVFEQLGRALVVEPFLGTLMAGRALAKAGGQEALLGEVIAGTTLLAFAHEEPQSRYDLADVETRATRAGDGWALSGHKAVVLQIEAADRILVSARVAGQPGEEAGIGLFLVDKTGATLRGYPMIDGGRGGELALDNTPATLITEDGYPLIEETVSAGIVALAWEAVGVMDVLKASTLDYLRTRKQFGVPIGKFQALQHRMATVALEIEQARSAAINAADALDKDRHIRERAVSAAKYTIGKVGTLAAEESIQMHGGIGMTWELPLSHFAKRLTMIGHQLGDDDHHIGRYIALGRAA
ncbi:acyl-CoA dehydrogenase family protein [Sphingomonas sp. CGMCC 1.13654]|uniref:Acyl-CoA dehydrogenase family protein n=1 Tax=Sphingomonas chungangi TaxID=2683589 RepID=A0A838L143_9SPHN|nr:acyl-CoA dehydrogenase [Sphingomonas chungangi]MBA2932660.1 acyl-CoA dehydrogenase family protein [Sphingomonas chungangi]MVW56283.1 pimeloyl-CoA dehydrogenase small subunit [Sphingomonas chungangi]